MTKFRYILSLLLFSAIFFISDIYAQCKEFTEDKAMPMLEDYVISGRYSMQKMSEGQEVLVLRTLSKGIKYRFVIKADENLPQNVKLYVETYEGQKLYCNCDYNYNSIWDFTCDQTQRVKIWLSVPQVSKTTEEPMRGCIAFLIGIKSTN